jgi:CBS domain-containing protein
VPTVGDLMSRELVRVSAEDSIEDAAGLMSGRRVGSALVFDGERLVGILTERDVLRVVGERKLVGARVNDWMTRDPETVGAEETVAQAGVLMLHGGFRHLPVVDGEDVVGIISIRDLVNDALDDHAPRGV